MSDAPSIIRNVSVIETENSPSILDPPHVVVNNIEEPAVNVTNDGDHSLSHHEDTEEKDDESDYSYTYDEEEEYSGFLIPTAPVRVEEDAVDSTANAAASTETSAATVERKQKWVEPPKSAITMSLRAERESTGGRRRLASDLYKIMSSPTHASGFTLSPRDEDSMDAWCISLFDFDPDSNLAKDLLVVGLDCVELEMTFPEQYPFEPPFVRVVSPRFERQTGFVMNGALCMELLTKDGWNPINDIESVIVSIRSLMVVGDGRVKAAVEMEGRAYAEALKSALERKKKEVKRKREEEEGGEKEDDKIKSQHEKEKSKVKAVGSYSAAEASTAYDHLSKFHQEKGWDKNGWWAKRG
jgi:ubiquitin-conjugating enzyme E2 Q